MSPSFLKDFCWLYVFSFSIYRLPSVVFVSSEKLTVSVIHSCFCALSSFPLAAFEIFGCSQGLAYIWVCVGLLNLLDVCINFFKSNWELDSHYHP